MQGVYQGNGAGPIIWAVVSSPLLRIMKEEGFGTFFKTSLSGQDIRIVGYAFVDDTDLIQTGRNSHTTGEEVCQDMQKALNLWEGLIRATGGALVVEKSSWWLIDFRWNVDGSARYVTTMDHPGELRIKDADGVIKCIPRLDPSEAFVTLGTCLAPDGNGKEQMAVMVDQAKTWAARIRTAPLKWSETTHALRTTIFKKLEYVLPVTSLTEEECDTIMRPILMAALPKAGYNRNFPRKVFFGSPSLLGSGFDDLHTTQIIEHISMISQHGPLATLTGQLLRGTLEAAKLELGLSGRFLSHSYCDFEHLRTDCWIKVLWSEVWKYRIKVNEQTPNLTLV
jgi:hypothetical protein